MFVEKKVFDLSTYSRRHKDCFSILYSKRILLALTKIFGNILQFRCRMREHAKAMFCEYISLEGFFRWVVKPCGRDVLLNTLNELVMRHGTG